MTSGFSAEATANSVLKKHLYVPAAPSGGQAGWVKDKLPIRQGDRVYIKSDGSAISSGTVYFNLWTALFALLPLAKLGLGFFA